MRRGWIGRPIVVALVVLFGGPVEAWSQERAVISGRLVDQETREPVADAVVRVVGPDLRALTDAGGRFTVPGVQAGRFRLAVYHVAYGSRGGSLTVAAGEEVEVRVTVSRVAIGLEPLTVIVDSREARAGKTRGTRVNFVGSEELREIEATSLNIGDVLLQHVAGVTVRQRSGVPGAGVCLEFRVRSPDPSRCRQPVIVMDGTPLVGGRVFLETFPLREVESLELIPAAEAGVRHGLQGANGALLVRTRTGRSRRRDGEGAGEETTPGSPGPSGLSAYDWSVEPDEHPGLGSFFGGVLGNAAGLGAAALLAGDCRSTAGSFSESEGGRCGTARSIGSWASAVILPALGTALGARIGGDTSHSRGRLLPSFVASSAVLVPGLTFLVTGSRWGQTRSEVFGAALTVLGPPLAATLTDHLFRRER